MVKQGKTIRHYSEFELIDDFSAGVAKNKYQSEWEVKSRKEDKLTLERGKKDSVSPVGGGSLLVHYRMQPKSEAKISSSLDNLDMSRAKSWIGRVEKKGWEEFKGSVWVALTDTLGGRSEIELGGRYIVGDQSEAADWVDFSVPLKTFKGVETNQLAEFEIVLKSGSDIRQGTLAFDEFGFYGCPDLVFESARDNLRGFPSEEALGKTHSLPLGDERKLLKQLAYDTWQYFEWSVDAKTGLIVDHIRTGRNKGIGGYTSPTDIAFYWLGAIAAYDLGFIKKEDAIQKIRRSLKSVERFETWGESDFYNFYHTRSLEPTRRYISSVDNGWVVAALAVIRQAFPGEFDAEADRIIGGINFEVFFDPSNGHVRLGFDEDRATFSPYHYGMLVSEARLMSYVGIGKGDLPENHWWEIYRTPPKEWDWQNQVPKGITRRYDGKQVFEGYYVYNSREIVPSWGGSLFECLAPMLLVDEQKLGLKGLAKNNVACAEAHLHYALEEKGYPVWGIAPAAIENGKMWSYREYGIKAIAVKGYADDGVITPYASILAIDIKPKEVVENLRRMIELYPDLYGPYGLYDSVTVAKKLVNKQYLALDHGMILIALSNYLTDGAIRRRFHQDLIGKTPEVLLKEERFFD